MSVGEVLSVRSKEYFLEATAASGATVSTSVDSAGTQAETSPEKTSNVTADKALGDLSHSLPTSPDDPEFDIGGEKIRLSKLRSEHERRKEHHRAASQKFDEAAALRKQVSGALEMIQRDPEEALRRFGIDPEQFATKTLTKRMQQEQMTPEQREQMTRQAQLADREAQIAERERAIEQRHQAEVVGQWEQRFQVSFANAAKQVGLPQSARVLARMADIADSYLANDRDDVTFTEIAEQVRDELAEENGHFLKELDGKSLLSVLPPDVVKALRQELAAQVRPVQQPVPQQQTERASPRQKGGFISMEQARANIAKKVGVR